MKKLLIISDMYPYATNPVSGVFVQQQVQHLLPYYEVQVVATRFPAPHKFERVLDGGIMQTKIEFPQLRFLPLTVINYWRYVLPSIRKLLKEWQPDIIHVHDCRHIPELLALSGILRRFQGKKILTVHNSKTLPEYAETWLHAFVYRLTLKRSYAPWTHVFCVNERLRQSLQKYVPLSRSSNLGNALPDLPEMPVPVELTDWLRSDSCKIIAVGNLKRTKGFDLLIRAAAKLIQNHYTLQIMILGSGPEHSRLEALIHSMGLQEQIRMTGTLINPLVRNLYSYFDAFALPSYSETFGIVYLEAMSAGLPIIGVQGQGIDGIAKEGVSGLFIRPQSLADLTAKIRWLIEHPLERAVIGQAGREIVERDFRMDGLIAKIREQYEA